MGLYLVYEVGDKEFRLEFQKEIEAWLVYQDQKRFGRFIEKVIQSEMSKFHITKKEIEKIVKELYEEPEWRITVVEPIKYQLRLQQIFDSYETVAV